MLLDDLVTAIQTVQARIREHGNILSQNEYRTRLALIDPILDALGWDVSNPDLVLAEYEVGKRRADYALLGDDGQPKALIEAKHLGEMGNPSKHEDQVFDYAFKQKVRFAGLTDGDRWIFEDVVAGFSGGQSRLLDVTISNESAYQCALKFLLLWHPTFSSGEPLKANEPFLEEEKVYPPPPPPTSPNPPSEWISLTNYEYSHGQPSFMRLPDSQEKQLAHWYGIVENTAEWLIEEGKLTTSMCPIKDIVSSDLLSEGGARYLRYGELKNGLFFNKNKSAKDHLRGLRILLRQCGLDPSSILLKSS